MNNSVETAPMPAKDRSGTAQRLPLIKEGLRQGKSRRKIADGLGVNERTIRRDLDTLLLPEEEQAKIQRGAAVEPLLRKARKQQEAEKARKAKEQLVQQHQKRLREEAASGKHSKSLARRSASWLKGKELFPEDVELILEIADRKSWSAGDRMGVPKQDADEVFEALDCEKTPREMTARIEYYARVLASSLIALAPERQIRDSAIKKTRQTFTPPMQSRVIFRSRGAACR